MKITELAKIAKLYELENSNSLRDSIVSEYTDILNSLDTIEEGIINKNINTIPVYKIDGEDNSYIEENYIEPINEVLSADYNFTMSYNINFVQRKLYPLWMLKKTKKSFEKRLNKYETQLKEFKKMNEEEKEKLCFKINAANNAYSAGMAAATTMATNAASDGQYTLTYIEIPAKITPYNYESVVTRMIKKMKYDINKLDTIIDKKEKTKGLKESYLVNLEDLKYIVKTEQCTLQEAVQKIKDINYIGDLYDVSVILPENINEYTTMENFINLCKVLKESNIGIVSTKDLNNVEFIEEVSSFFTNKMSEKMLKKKINDCEETIDELNKKLKEFEKMSDQEQKKFLLNKSVKVIFKGTILGLAVPVVGSAVYITYKTMKGDNTVCTPKMYKNNIRVLISAYNVDLKSYKKALSNKSKK